MFEPPTRRIVRLICALALTALVGCSSRSPRNQFTRDVQEIVSAAAASRLAVDCWQGRAVPTSYALDTLKGAETDVRQEIQSIATLEAIDPRQRDRARNAAERVVALCGLLQQQVGQANGAAAARTRQELDAVEHTLREMASGGEQ